MTIEKELLGMRLLSRKPCIVHALADDHIMFLAPNPKNISKTKYVWEMFSSPSRLRINMHNIIVLISSMK